MAFSGGVKTTLAKTVTTTLADAQSTVPVTATAAYAFQSDRVLHFNGQLMVGNNLEAGVNGEIIGDCVQPGIRPPVHCRFC